MYSWPLVETISLLKLSLARRLTWLRADNENRKASSLLKRLARSTYHGPTGPKQYSAF